MNKIELKHVSNLVLFARVVQSGSISKCATVLGMDRVTISRRIKYLEESMGVELLHRTARRVATTAEGKRCFEVCVRILENLKCVNLAAAGINSDIHHKEMAVRAPPDIFDNFLEAPISKFEADHPDITISRRLCSSSIFARDSIPAIDIGWAPASRNGGLTKTLLSVKQAVYGSPTFLSRFTFLNHPDQLNNVPCIGYATNSKSSIWAFRKNQSAYQHRVTGETSANSLLEVRESAIAGLGLCMIPEYLGEPFVKFGKLSRVLGSFRASNRELVSTISSEYLAESELTLFRLALEEYFARYRELPWSERAAV